MRLALHRQTAADLASHLPDSARWFGFVGAAAEQLHMDIFSQGADRRGDHA
jgi:hypothetical protein